ncbi:MAG: hypothetical protein M5U07_12505 [Xanthobacteraceae bacterium]|nr:hypothetical protein [Xanthobacteraceae bacterium]
MPTAPVAAIRHTTRPILVVAAVAGAVLTGTLALWAWYGTAVFAEMVLAGLAACF